MDEWKIWRGTVGLGSEINGVSSENDSYGLTDLSIG